MLFVKNNKDPVGYVLSALVVTVFCLGIYTFGYQYAIGRAYEYPRGKEYVAVEDCALDLQNDVFGCLVREKGTNDTVYYLRVRTASRSQIKKGQLFILKKVGYEWYGLVLP